MTRHVRYGVEFAAVSKSYGAVRAVRGVDLQIAPGETVALLGPNGAGKSTAIDLMLGLAVPDAGSVRIFGDEPRAATRAGRIGGMLQLGGLIPYLTVRELITSVAALYPNALSVDDVITITAIGDFADRPTNKLSGGQIQRARFAMTLVANTDLLILDEPTVAMDVEGRREFWTTVRGIAASGKTVIFATHYLDEADEYADRIVLMSQGEIVADGASTEIRGLVGGQVVRATLAGVAEAELLALPGVIAAELRGDSIMLSCTDSDAAVRELFASHPSVKNLSVAAAGLEEAFLQLTGNREREAVR
ncbi:MAG TPA: ABC transporter ATP-binding protein [Jatrophihabitans sp.]|nr:ABC transporter ATP-binding protein [Jatrophihabitans sp.]